jgi:hydroxypyruvate isomerase
LVPVSLTAVVAEAEWQLSSQPEALMLADALPAPNLPFDPDTFADQRTDGALQLTYVENDPLIVTRFANS